MFYRGIIICVAVQIMFYLVGCSERNDQIESKRKQSIERSLQNYRSRSLVIRTIGTNLVMAASAATAINLNSPRVPSAAILRDNEGKYYLIVYWLEEVSSVDGIELLLNQANAHVILHEDFSDLEENRKDGEVSIIFAAFWTGLNVEGAWQTIDQTTDVSYIKVRLLKRGSPISDWYPVNCYRVDHLQGTQKIVELKEGSFKVSI